MQLWRWFVVQHDHRPVLVVLVEHLRCGQRALPGTTAAFDVDDDYLEAGDR